MKQSAAHGTFDAIAVWKRPPNGPIHVHWLLRWSPLDRDDLDRRIRRALKKLVPNMPDRCLMVQPAKTTSKIAKYMAKGIDAPYADHFYLKHSPQGPIHHRRIIISRSLGRRRARSIGRKPGFRRFDTRAHRKRIASPHRGKAKVSA